MVQDAEFRINGQGNQIRVQCKKVQTPKAGLKYSQYFPLTKVLIDNSGISDTLEVKNIFAMPLKKYIKKLIEPPDQAEPTGIDYFRERLLLVLLLGVAGFGSIAYLPSIYYGFVYKYFSVIFIDTLALGWVFFLLLKKNLSFFHKSTGLLIIFYILGVWLLVILGPTGAGFMWLLLFSIMAGVLLGFKPALLSFALNVATIAVLSVLVFKQILTWQLIAPDEMAIWAVKGVNFICINAIVAISTGFLITKISWMVKEEQQRRSALALEMQARLHAEEENKELTTRLYQSQKMEAMGTLAGGVAHDFNNILSTIMGYTELSLLEPKVPEEVRQNLDHIIRAGERAKGISHQILTFSRHTSSHKVPNDLGQIAKECVDFFTIGISPGITLTRDIPGQPFPILADKNQIYQVIMNLLTNGLQAMDHALKQKDENKRPEKEYKLSLSVTYIPTKQDSSTAENSLALIVKDTGKGIPPDLVARIFEPYFTTKETGKGTGMGLSISHGIIKDHGGEIFVESDIEKGSTFTVVLPVHGKTVPVTPTVINEALGGREHILMVDDETDVLNIQKSFLIPFGYRVTGCSDPSLALDMIRNRSHKFDLVVTDRKMPGITGNELYHRISGYRPGLPVILCSGFPSKEDEELFDSVLVKPITRNDLATAVRRILDKPKP